MAQVCPSFLLSLASGGKRFIPRPHVAPFRLGNVLLDGKQGVFIVDDADPLAAERRTDGSRVASAHGGRSAHWLSASRSDA